ncbi:MAG: GDSL-type esterase/lipase family protein [Pseudomonadota bacterium]
MLKKILRALALAAVLVLGYFAVRDSIEATKSPPPPPEYGFLVLGDAYTAPKTINPSQRWAQQVVTIFREERFSVRDPQYLAEEGMKTERLVSEIDRPEFQYPYNLVLLQIGAADIVAGVTAEDYRVKFSNLLIKAISLVEGDPAHVIVLSIPDWTAIQANDLADRESVRQKINRFNEINDEVSHQTGVRYVSVTNLSRMAAHDLSLLTEDRKALSEHMHQLWARKIYPVALTALGH